MDPECDLLDVIRCHLCETPAPSLHCDICVIHLCNACEKKHLSDVSTEHMVVPFRFRGCTCYCQKHFSKLCESFCEQCSLSICALCVSSLKHRGHKVVRVINKLESKKGLLQKDLKELEHQIYPKYKAIACHIKDQKINLYKNSRILTTAIDKHGEDLHREIDTLIKNLKSEACRIDCKNLGILDDQEDEIKCSISEITQGITDLNKLLVSNDVSVVSAYKSRNAEFKTLPHKLAVSFPKFYPPKISKNQLIQQVGSLSVSSSKTEVYGYKLDSSSTESSLLDRPFIDGPQIIENVDTKYVGLHCVSCLSDEQIWTCFFMENLIRLYNLQGELVKSIKTKSGKTPWAIDVTRSGDLVYTDYTKRTVNIVNKTKINRLIKLQGWIPLNICTSSSGELLIIVASNDDKQTKVVRYFGSTEKQSIQYNDAGHPLYSFGNYIKYISENRNQDICVSDQGACKVVVVNMAGKFRYSYTGPPSISTTTGPFYPTGITTDSQSQILTADSNNHRIHIIDQDGQFLRFIDNCHLRSPHDLSVDTRDNLFVVELETGKVKKIQYCMN